MKILDRYIFFSFVKTFFSVLIILILIFLLQSIWVYISELAGKDLDAVVIGKLLFYLTPKVMPMVLPLTILVSSIMTFGSFAENYEFAAMKSSGISLQRVMRSLIFFITILSVVTFFFANDIIPWSVYKAKNMRNNIKKMKPAMAIVEGTFNEIGDYNIKVAKKTGKNGRDLHNVIIHKKMKHNRGMIVIKAESGKLQGSMDSDILSLILYDGNQYQKVYSENYRTRRRRPFIKNNFEEYTFNIDLSSFNDVDLDEDKYNGSASMLNISELRLALDSLSKKFNQDQSNFANTMWSRSGAQRMLKKEGGETKIRERNPRENNKHQKDRSRSSSTSPPEKQELNQSKNGSSETYDIKNMKEFYDSYDAHSQLQMVNLALTSTRGTLGTIQGKKKNFNKKKERLNKMEIEIYDKYALAVMCYVLFFVGAPLGAIIRKGGIGMPMVVAILLFLTYYYIGMFAKNSAENGSLNPFFATWLSTFIMLPLSVAVTYRATTDQGIFSLDILTTPIRKFFAKIDVVKKKKKENNS